MRTKDEVLRDAKTQLKAHGAGSAEAALIYLEVALDIRDELVVINTTVTP